MSGFLPLTDLDDVADRICSVHPVIEYGLLSIRDRFAETSISLKTRTFNATSAAPIDPYAVYWVDPNQISLAMKPFSRPKWRLAGRVIEGDWDRTTRPFSEIDGSVDFAIYDSFRSRFIENIPWEETEFYHRLISEIKNGRSWWDCQTVNDVRVRCTQLDRMYASMKLEGYQRHEDLAESNTGFEIGRASPVHRIVESEIAVNIGRDGELIFYDGRNRLAMAKILDLDRIPVVILVRHRRWQLRREAIGNRETGSPSQRHQAHPDID